MKVKVGDGEPEDLGSEPGTTFVPPPELPADVAEALEKGKQAEERLAKIEETVEPHLNIIKRPEYREWLQEEVEAGVVENPNPPPPVTSADVAEHRRIVNEDGFEEVQAALIQYAQTLPEHEQELLNSNYAVYNKAYRDMRENLGDLVKKRPPFVPPVPGKPSAEQLAQSIAQKEVLKKFAAVEDPGDVRPPETPRAREKEIAAIRKELRNNPAPGLANELEGRLAQLLYAEDK